MSGELRAAVPGSDALKGLRALDLTDAESGLCGKMMADLGIDVIKVEPPGGDPSRLLPPFVDDDPGPDRGIAWLAFNINKRSATLDMASEVGRAVLRKLVATADFLVESFRPGYLTGLGLGYEQLAGINPRLIFTSITPFGQTGPYGQYASSDITMQAMGGFMYVNGDEDRRPIPIGSPVALAHASAQACAASMIAHYYRQRTGHGQHVDVSAQECIVWTPLQMTMASQLAKQNFMRAGDGGRFRMDNGPSWIRGRWACKDGHLMFAPIGQGNRSRAGFAKLIDVMRRDGEDVQELTARDWAGDAPPTSQEEYDIVANRVQRYLLTKTSAELYDIAVKEGLFLAPFATVKDIIESPQTQARGAVVSVEYPHLGRSFLYPGPFAQMSATPISRFRRAPRVGEHNDEVYQSLGYTTEEMGEWRSRRII